MNHFTRMLLGGFAGLLGWALIEPGSRAAVASSVAWNSFEMRLILVWGLLIGLSIGGYNGYLQGSRTHVVRGLALGGLLGAIGATLGYGFGGRLEEALFGPMSMVQVNGNLITKLLARVTALLPLGVCLGAAIGASTIDWRRALHGAIGGAIGAGAGAILFDLVGYIMSGVSLTLQGVPAGSTGEVGQIPRAIFALAMGSMIALFIGLVEQLARQAWVRQALGRNEGREWAIYGARTAIGRSETVQIPIFGDLAIAPVHAFIDRRGHEYWLLDAGSGAPTFLNGQPVAAAPLMPGAQIQVGNTMLQFLLRGNAPAPSYAPIPGPAVAQPMPVPSVPPLQPSPMPSMPSPSMPTTVMAPPAAAGPALVAVDGPLRGQRFPLVGVLEIGRESTGLPLPFDSGVSRRHATISVAPTGLLLNDLGSTNGSFVNGVRVSTSLLRPGDRVRFGGSEFVVEQ